MDGSTPHRRYNPLLDEWILVSPHRTQRPWQGQVEEQASPQPAYDPECYLCPGNLRASGERNPDYQSTFVFTNDYPALLPESNEAPRDGLFQTMPATGTCRVICYSPNHATTMAHMSQPEIRSVVSLWSDQSAELGERYHWVQVFENKGSVMGCSNPHPHGQIWATDQVPTIPAKEGHCQHAYFAKHGRDLLGDVLREELASDERVVCANGNWVAWVPFWAAWPFETILAPRTPVQRLDQLSSEEQGGLADILATLLPAYDRLFEVSMPYSMGWHGAPLRQETTGWRVHAHFYPPLLRSATVRKFMVGYEMLAEPQRDLTPEAAAKQLREYVG